MLASPVPEAAGAMPEDQLLVQFQGMIAEYERAQIANEGFKLSSAGLATAARDRGRVIVCG